MGEECQEQREDGPSKLFVPWWRHTPQRGEGPEEEGINSGLRLLKGVLHPTSLVRVRTRRTSPHDCKGGRLEIDGQTVVAKTGEPQGDVAGYCTMPMGRPAASSRGGELS